MLAKLSPSCLLVLLFAALASCGRDVSVADPEDETPPNVVFILLDTLRADRLGSYGYPRPTSPNLDALAAGGVRFADATAQSSWTMPSMASMIQGKYVTEFRDVPRENAGTMAEFFRDAGYRTEGLVANTLLTDENQFHRGYDHYDAEPQDRRVMRERIKSERVKDVARWAEDMVPLALERTDLHLAETSEQPLFLYVHLMDVHAKYRKHEDWSKELPMGKLPKRYPTAWHEARYAEHLAQFEDPTPHDPKIWNKMNQARGFYDREIRHTDAWVQKLVDGLAERGVLDNAIVVVASDHGETLWEQPDLRLATAVDALSPAQFFHAQHDRNLTQGLVHTPLFFFGTGIPEGLVVEHPVENIDILPTLMHLCGLPHPGGLQGSSLVGLMQGESEALRPLHSMVLQRRMLRDPESGYKLTLPTTEGVLWSAQVQLFDLEEDPDEQVNLAAEKPEVVERMQAELEAWVEAHPDQSTLGRERNSRTLDMLEALGYASPGEEE